MPSKEAAPAKSRARRAWSGEGHACHEQGPQIQGKGPISGESLVNWNKGVEGQAAVSTWPWPGLLQHTFRPCLASMTLRLRECGATQEHLSPGLESPIPNPTWLLPGPRAGRDEGELGPLLARPLLLRSPGSEVASGVSRAPRPGVRCTRPGPRLHQPTQEEAEACRPRPVTCCFWWARPPRHRPRLGQCLCRAHQGPEGGSHWALWTGPCLFRAPSALRPALGHPQFWMCCTLVSKDHITNGFLKIKGRG